MEATDRPGDSMPQGTLDELVKNGATIDVLLEFELRLINVCVNPEVVISTITYSWKLTGTFGGKLVTDCTLPAC